MVCLCSDALKGQYCKFSSKLLSSLLKQFHIEMRKIESFFCILFPKLKPVYSVKWRLNYPVRKHLLVLFVVNNQKFQQFFIEY